MTQRIEPAEKSSPISCSPACWIVGDAAFCRFATQNTLAPFRKKRLMTVSQLFLIHRYNASAVHYVTPTEDNELQTQRMKSVGIFSDVHTEIGQIIVAQVSKERVAELLMPDRVVLLEMIRKTSAAGRGRIWRTDGAGGRDDAVPCKKLCTW